MSRNVGSNGWEKKSVGSSCEVVDIPDQRQPYMVHSESCSGTNWLPDFSETKWRSPPHLIMEWSLLPGKGPWKSLVYTQGPIIRQLQVSLILPPRP